MHPITAPIKHNDRGPLAGNLIECLLFLIDQGVVRTIPFAPRPTPEELKELAGKARQEGADQWFGEAAQRLVFDLQLQQGLGDHLRGQVDAATADCLNALLKKHGAPLEEGYRISGTVRDADRNAIAGALVTAWDRDLRKLQLLGQARTDEAGAYAIAYDRSHFARADASTRKAPWLIVEAKPADDAAEAVRVEIPSAQAQAVQTVHLTLAGAGAGPSEWQRVGDAVLPLLAGQGGAAGPVVGTHEAVRDLFPAELNASDLDFIEAETGLSRAALDAWAAASRIVQEMFSVLQPAAPERLEVLRQGGWPYTHALVRQHLGDHLDAVLQKKPEAWSLAWSAALAARQVPDLDEKVVAGVAEALEWVHKLRLLDPGRPAASPLAQVLASTKVPVPQDVALTALPILQQQGTENPDALLQLHEQYPAQGAAINALVRGVRVHRLVGGHAGLLRELNARLDGDSDSIAPLARLAVGEWTEAARLAGVGVEQVLPMQIRMEAQHPLVALQARMEQGRLALPDETREAVATLMKDDAGKVESLFQGKTRIVDKQALGEGEQVLKNLGTFGRLGVGMELGARLIKAGIGTPAVAMQYGREHLREILHEQDADEDVVATVDAFRERIEEYVEGGRELTIRTGNSYFVPAGMYELPDPLPPEARENLPTIPGLFGNLDDCACRSCESMLGQPAYLVDLLELLRKKPSPAARAPLDVLQERRPHIFTMELDCENAETPVQHIDLVLEILEEAGRGMAGREIYESLAVQCFPWGLPFNRSRATANAYLARLGVERAALLRLLRGWVEPERWAAELLDVAYDSGRSVEWDRLTADRPTGGRRGHELWELYGLVDGLGNVAVHDPVSGEDLRGKRVEEVARRISVLLDRTGLELEAFESLLATQYVGRWTIVNRAQCKTSEMSLGTGTNALETCLHRIYRMVRLSRKLPGWSFAELDGAFTIGQGANPLGDKELVMRVATLNRMADRHHVPVATLLALPGSLGALYSAVGLRPVHAGLLQRMTGWTGTATPVDWEGLDRLLAVRTRIDQIGLAVEDLACAFLPRADIEALLQPLPRQFGRREQIDRVLAGIRSRLREVAAIAPDVPLARQVHQLLSEVVGADAAAFVVHAMEDAAAVPAVPLEAGRRDRAVALLSDAPAGPRGLGQWRPLLSQADAGALLAGSSNAGGHPSAGDRFTALLTAAWPVRRERALVAAVSESMEITQSEAVALLTDRLLLDPAANQPEQAQQLFLHQDFWGTGGSVAPSLWKWADRLHRLLSFKATIGAARFDIVASRMEWRRVLAADPSTGLNAEQQRLLDWLWLGGDERLAIPALGATLEVLDRPAATLAQALAPVARRFELPDAQTQAIALVAGLSDPAGLREAGTLVRLYELLVLAKTLGADADRLGRLADDSNASSLEAMKALAQTALGLDAAAWPPVRRQIEDPVRQQRRDALVAYLVHMRPAWRNANDLYEHYLIDPLVGPCLTTTPMLEAISATQLFAQRVLFGLEAGVKASQALQQQWTWMRNYRVWEANRKVYLFPENWLYPELRDDKSSSFRRLESRLGQGALDADLADEAFGAFLDDVAQMAQLEVLGLYEDARDGRRALFVVGRTSNPPYSYYWRKCADFGSRFMEWSAWQQIELDLQGDHVHPFFFAGKLYVAWLVFRQAASEQKKSAVTVAWSCLEGLQWRKPQVCREQVDIPTYAFQMLESSLVMRCQVTDQAANLTLYLRSELAGTEAQASQGIVSTSTVDLDDRKRDEFNARCMREQHHSFGQIVIPAHDASPTQVRGGSDGQPRGAHLIGAVLIVTWEVWIKARSRESGSGYVRLNSDRLSQVKLRILAETADGVPFFSQGIEDALGAWVADAGGQSIPDLRFRLRTNSGTGTCADLQVGGVPAGKQASVHLTLVCDFDANSPDMPFLDALGINARSEFVPFNQFRIRSNQLGSWLHASDHRDNLALLDRCSVLQNSQVGTAMPLYLRGADNVPAISPFSPVPPHRIDGLYRVLGASSSRPPAAAPDTWYFRDESDGCFLDVSGDGVSRYRAVTAYAASFNDASQYPERWGAGRSLDALSERDPTFGADGLPDLDPAYVTASWQEQLAGKWAWDARAPYGCYNWEVFLHAPLMVADQLSKQHKFEEAERWLRCIFDPTSATDGSDATRFLKFRGFRNLDLRRKVVDDLKALAQTASGHYTEADVEAVETIILRWREAPFRPFVVARGRQLAFLWRTLFAYLDNLVAWADSLYRRDTRESNNEAMMLYVLAQKILGHRPVRHPGTSARPALTYAGLQGKLDAFSNFWIDVGSRGRAPRYRGGRLVSRPPASSAGMLLFCMPANDKIAGYWATVDDRLFNLRHCRNIEGVQRNPPFVDAPIDPALLVRAVAAGLDLGSVVSGLYAPAPHYRYIHLASRATELAAEVRALGAAMLAAMEKRDSEQLVQLRSSNEISLLKLAGDVRKLQVSEAESQLVALRVTRKSAEARYGQYQRLLGRNGPTPTEGSTVGEESMLGNVSKGLASGRSDLGLIQEENLQYGSLQDSSIRSEFAGVTKVASGAFHAASSISDPPGIAHRAFSGLGHAASAAGDGLSLESQKLRVMADRQSMLGGHLRRRDEWAFQSNQALRELRQIDKQILASEIRIRISQKEFDHHVEQVEQAQAVDEVMRSKFTNVQLYEWMSKELCSLHDRTYRLALDMARRAERAAARELGTRSLNVIGNEHWNSLRQGLLAGEKLHQELKQLEVAYLDQNRREFELTRHVSLRRLDPEALVRLRLTQRDGGRGTNQCEFEIPEWLFDLDTPGHYLRRIKSVSVSIPCVAGPYASVHCKLTQLSSHIRHDKLAGGGYARGEEDPRFTDYYGASDAIVTSSAGSDSGLFETQLRDDRFLPFEGSGVISRWRLELPGEFRQFDYATISDVVLTIRYTARDGGDGLRDQATAAIRAIPERQGKPLNVLLSGRSDFPTEWAASAGGNGAMTLALKPELLPYWMAAAQLRVGTIGYYDVRGTAAPAIAFTPVAGYRQGDETVTLPRVTADLADRLVLLRLGFPAGTS